MILLSIIVLIVWEKKLFVVDCLVHRKRLPGRLGVIIIIIITWGTGRSRLDSGSDRSLMLGTFWMLQDPSSLLLTLLSLDSAASCLMSSLKLTVLFLVRLLLLPFPEKPPLMVLLLLLLMMLLGPLSQDREDLDEDDEEEVFRVELASRGCICCCCCCCS